MDRFCKYIPLHKYILESTELVSQSLLKKGKLEGRWETPLVPMQKGKHWNAKYQPKPQLWSLHRDVFKARHCWGNVHTISVWGISLPVRIMFCKDDWDNICYSACHLYHGIPRLEPRKPPRKLSHTFSTIERAKKERGRVRRKTIWGKNLSAAQLGAMSETKGTAPKSQSQGHRRQTEEATQGNTTKYPEKTSINTE